MELADRGYYQPTDEHVTHLWLKSSQALRDLKIARSLMYVALLFGFVFLLAFVYNNDIRENRIKAAEQRALLLVDELQHCKGLKQ
jgi:TRAP-type C4-dicarboxylate transport system permease small subunit